MPDSLSSDAQALIRAMLVVDPLKRITIPEITQHPFFLADLPAYLQPLPPVPAVVGMSDLVSPPKDYAAIRFEVVEGLGRVEHAVVEELAGLLEDSQACDEENLKHESVDVSRCTGRY